MLPVSFGSQQLWSALTPLTALTALEGTLAIPSGPHTNLFPVDPGQPWGAIGSEAPSSLPVIQRLKRLGLKQLSRQLLNKQQVSGFMVAKGDISMLTKLESLCLDVTRDTPAQPIVKLPAHLLELHTSALSTGRIFWSNLSSLKRLSIEVAPAEVSATVSLEGVPSALQELNIIGGTNDELGFRFQGIRVMRCLQKFTWWGHPWGLASLHGHLMPVLTPSLREVELFIADWPELGPGHVTPVQVAAVAERMLSIWENRPHEFRVAGVVDADTLEVGPVLVL